MGALVRRSLSSFILALVMASIEEQNDQYSQREETDGKMSHVAQVRAHKDRE
jgi:hypothetical protein